VAARYGMECVVYMGSEDIKRQAPNVYRMKLLGATVVPVESGSRTLKDALNEAMRDWVTHVDSTFYILGTAAGPLGKVYANPMGTLTDYEAEIKEYGIEQGLFTGTVIEKTDALHIARNVRGGQVLGGKGKYFAVELLKRQVSGSGYNMMDYEDEDKPDNELFKRPIEKNTDQRLVDFGRYYYGRGDRFGNYSNFFFTQSANASKSENYVEDIDICGWWDPAAFTSTLRVSHAFDTEQHAPMWEGVALANYVYRFKDLMRTHQPFQQVDLDKYSFAEISAAEQHNTWLHTPTTKVYHRNEQFRKLRRGKFARQGEAEAELPWFLPFVLYLNFDCAGAILAEPDDWGQ